PAPGERAHRERPPAHGRGGRGGARAAGRDDVRRRPGRGLRPRERLRAAAAAGAAAGSGRRLRARTLHPGQPVRPLGNGPPPGRERGLVRDRPRSRLTRIAVAGGTGLIGSHVVEAISRTGHEAVVVARSSGVDVTSGQGLDDALAGSDAVIDVTNERGADAEGILRFFAAATGNLLAAETRAGVGHHVLLSIVGVDRLEGNAHYAGKRLQEELVSAGPVPFTIQRATQFHEFAEMIVSRTRQGDEAAVPPLLLQPAAA